MIMILAFCVCLLFFSEVVVAEETSLMNKIVRQNEKYVNDEVKGVICKMINGVKEDVAELKAEVGDKTEKMCEMNENVFATIDDIKEEMGEIKDVVNRKISKIQSAITDNTASVMSMQKRVEQIENLLLAINNKLDKKN